MKYLGRNFGVFAFAVVLLTLTAPVALTDTTDITIGTPNAALSGFTGPYANLNINLLDSTHATFTFTSLTTGLDTFLMGDGGAADLNVNGTYTLGPVTESGLTGFTPTFDANKPGNVDGFGTFNLSLNNMGGYTDAASTIVFTLTNTSGTWSSAADTLVANAHGAEAAIHAYACTALCTTSEGALATGFAANGGTNSIPEPRQIGVLIAMGGLMAISVRFRKRIPAN